MLTRRQLAAPHVDKRSTKPRPAIIKDLTGDCPRCGSEITVTRENHPYREAGLNGVTLHGIEVHLCRICADCRLELPNPESLHRLIAEAVIRKATRLTGAEIRYLRRCLGLSGTELARRMGASKHTVCRWEHATRPIGPQADRLIRLIVAQSLSASYPLDLLARIGTTRESETVLRFALKGEDWVLTTLR